jgi:hypothetical protein
LESKLNLCQISHMNVGCKHNRVYQILVNKMCALGYSRAGFLHALCSSIAENRVFMHVLRQGFENASSSENGFLVSA